MNYSTKIYYLIGCHSTIKWMYSSIIRHAYRDVPQLNNKKKYRFKQASDATRARQLVSDLNTKNTITSGSCPIS
jgi:hypothetical protein